MNKLFCKKYKKGMIFTVIAVLLVGVLIASSFLVTKATYNKKSFVAMSRVSSMNDFILSVEDDVSRTLIISGYPSLISINKYTLTLNGSFVNNFDVIFNEVMINGTINGEAQNLMENATLNDWADRINNEAKKININIIFEPRSVRIYHVSPWQTEIELNATLNITDVNGLASWYYTKTFKKTIDITSFEDPLYIIKGNPNMIIMEVNTSFVNRTNNDTKFLQLHLNNSYYVASNYSPSYLMRFKGNFSPSPFGIESFVNCNNTLIQNKDKSVLDYEYFNDDYVNSNDRCNITGMPSCFRIDKNRLNDYNLSGLGVDCP